MDLRSSSPISTPLPPPLTPEGLFEILKSLKIQHNIYHHPALYTVAEALETEAGIPGAHCRNLFLKDKKGAMFLVTALNETALDLKKLATTLNAGRFSFGSPERLYQYLGVTPGSVCPFAVVNDQGGDVQLVLDARMMQMPLVNYHPLINTMTIGLTPADLLKLVHHVGHEPIILDMVSLAPDT